MKFRMSATLVYVAAWLGAAALAFGLAVVSPSESRVMGHMPAFMSQTLSRQPLIVPEGFPSDRTLALITFKREQRSQAESWIDGLNLKNDTSISWMRVPVLNDPGTAIGRDAAEFRLRQQYVSETERAKLVPVFTDKADFARSVSLNGVGQSSVVIVNRQGEVLARAEGHFSAEKAQVLRETLLAPGVQ